ncbi:MAG: phosphonate transport system substrate-binding protein [Methyloprofundus sp.]|nr:MAG: phosphonate transport system substrate-binding protein [Methyloprofundus sp.]
MASMTLMVCPHDTAGDPLKWFQFAFYLTKYCNASTKYYKCLDFVEFHEKMSDADIVYANPQDSLELIEKHDFMPLVHSVNLYDEIVYIANNDVKSDSINAINEQECLSCNGMMVTRVGVKGLLEQQVQPAQVYSKDNWMAVVKAVSLGEKPYGFVYKDFYDGLNSMSKNIVTKVGETNEKSIFHSIFIKRKHQDKAQHFMDMLTQAHKDKKGVTVLQGVNIEKFIPVDSEEVLGFKALLALGSELIH